MFFSGVESLLGKKNYARRFRHGGSSPHALAPCAPQTSLAHLANLRPHPPPYAQLSTPRCTAHARASPPALAALALTDATADTSVLSGLCGLVIPNVSYSATGHVPHVALFGLEPRSTLASFLASTWSQICPGNASTTATDLMPPRADLKRSNQSVLTQM